MNNKQALTEIIQNLIAQKKEGEYWDFKQDYHKNAGDLVKDIICLANNPRHKGDRYLIYGVVDNTFDLVGVTQPTNKAISTQSKIIDTLRGSKFANNQIPDVRLERIEIDNKGIDVLIIKDEPYKPYYLEERKQCKEKQSIHAGAVYSRNGDANTPSDKVASPLDIEKMWRQRFGLDQTQLERVQIYLEDFENWEKSGFDAQSFYYKPYPEFTIIHSGDESIKNCGSSLSWTKIFPDPQAFLNFVYIKYHQTALKCCRIHGCDGWKLIVPNPDVYRHNDISPDLQETKEFYFFIKGTLAYSLLRFYLQVNQPNCPRSYCFDFLDEPNMTVIFPVAIFNDFQEKEDFLSHIKNNFPTILPRHIHTGFTSDHELITEWDRQQIGYGNAMKEALRSWRNSRMTAITA